MWALEYLTTPSSPFSGGPSPFTAIMECASTPGAIGRADSVWMNELDPSMLSMAVGKANACLAAPGFNVTRSTLTFVNVPGKLTSRRPSLPIKPSATKLPRCGVQMKTTVVTEGSGSTKIVRRSMSLVSADILDLLDRNFVVGIPEARAAVHYGHLGEQTSLTVADDHHLVHGGILALWIEVLHGPLQRFTQPHRRVGDRISSVVDVEPQLVALREHRVVHQLVGHLGPPRRTRSRAVDKDHRDAARADTGAA